MHLDSSERCGNYPYFASIQTPWADSDLYFDHVFVDRETNTPVPDKNRQALACIQTGAGA